MAAIAEMGQAPLVWLLSVSLKAALVLAFAGALTLALRRASALWRHRVWGMAVVGALVLPVAALLIPSWEVRLPAPFSAGSFAAGAAPSAAVSETLEPAEPEQRRPAAGAGVMSLAAFALSAAERSTALGSGEELGAGTVSEAGELSVPSHLAPLAGEADAARAGGGVASAQSASGRPFPWAFSWEGLFLLLWGLGAFAALAWQALGLARLRSLARRSTLLDSPEWTALLERCRRRLGLTRRVELRIAPEGAAAGGELSPMTWGLVRPVVLLPAAAREWTEGRREIVLLHELVHVKRADWSLRTLARIACAAYWLNPLVWLAARRLAVEQELACDEEVLGAGTRPSTYAAHLLAIARTLAPRSGVRPILPALEMARRSALEGRLMSILKPRSTPRRAPKLAALAPVAALMAILVFGLAAVDAVSGTPEEDIADILVELDSLEGEMAPFEARLESLEGELEPMEDDLQKMEEALDAGLEMELQALEEALEPYEAKLEALEQELAPFEGRSEELEAALEPYEERMRALERELEPFEVELDALEEEMAPTEAEMDELGERMEAIAEEMEAEMEGLQARLGDAASEDDRRRMAELGREMQRRMQPYQQRMQQTVQNFEPYRQRMQEIQQRMQPVLQRMQAVQQEMGREMAGLAELHREMEPYHQRFADVHKEMEPIHREMEKIHQRMEPHHREMEKYHQRMEPVHRQMEEVHREMEPIHRRIEELSERLDRAVQRALVDRLSASLGDRASQTEVSAAAEAIIDSVGIHVQNDVLRLRSSPSELREIIARAAGLAADDPAVERAAASIAEMEIKAPRR